jgi:hypothetical protein
MMKNEKWWADDEIQIDINILRFVQTETLSERFLETEFLFPSVRNNRFFVFKFYTILRGKIRFTGDIKEMQGV